MGSLVNQAHLSVLEIYGAVANVQFATFAPKKVS